MIQDFSERYAFLWCLNTNFWVRNMPGLIVIVLVLLSPHVLINLITRPSRVTTRRSGVSRTYGAQRTPRLADAVTGIRWHDVFQMPSPRKKRMMITSEIISKEELGKKKKNRKILDLYPLLPLCY